MIAVFSWFLRRTGIYPLLALGLLFVSVSSVDFGLRSMVRGLDLALLLGVSALALLAGWLLARLRGGPASLTICALGIIVVLLSVGGLTRAVLSALRSLAAFSAGLMRWPYSQPDPSPALAVLREFASQLNAVLIHLRDWLISIFARQPAFDLVAINLVWCLSLWLAAAWAAWWVRRYDHPLAGLTPIIVVLAAAAGITEHSIFYLVPMLAALLLLLVIASHHRRETRWERTGVDYSFEVRADLAFSAVVLTAGLTLAATF